MGSQGVPQIARTFRNGPRSWRARASVPRGAAGRSVSQHEFPSAAAPGARGEKPSFAPWGRTSRTQQWARRPPRARDPRGGSARKSLRGGRRPHAPLRGRPAVCSGRLCLLSSRSHGHPVGRSPHRGQAEGHGPAALCPSHLRGISNEGTNVGREAETRMLESTRNAPQRHPRGRNAGDPQTRERAGAGRV